MTDEKVAVELEAHSHEIGSLKHRMETVEKKQEAIVTLASSVEKLAINMQYMADEQKEQGQRLQKLEGEPIESSKYWRRLILGAIITTVIGIVIGAVMANIL